MTSGGTIIGTTGTDTIIARGGSLDLSHTTLSSLEVLTTSLTTGTTFTVNQADLASINTVIGNGGVDILMAAGGSLDLTGTTLSGIQVLQAAGTGATVFTLSQNDLLSVTSVIGNGANDTFVASSTRLDLSGTTLSSMEVLKAGSTAATTFTLSQGELASSGDSIIGNAAGTDTLVFTGTANNLTNTTLSGIDALQAGSTANTTFTVTQGELVSGGSVIGNAGTDTLIVTGNSVNLSQTTLSSVEVIQASGSTATTFTLAQADLTAGGSIIGSAGIDTIVAAATSLDLSGTTLSSIEVLKAGSTAATTFTLVQADLTAGGSIIGSAGKDTIVAAAASLDLSGTTLSSVEVIQAGNSGATSFTLTQAELSGETLIGNGGTDTLVAATATVNLAYTTLSGIQVLQGATGASGDVFTLSQADLTSGGSVIGTTGTNTIVAAGRSLDLSATTLSGIEVIQAGTATSITLAQTELSNLTSVIGNGGTDTLVVSGTMADLGATTLSGISVLDVTGAGATITLTSGQLAALSSVIGNGGTDTLVVTGGAVNLSGTTLSGIQAIQTAASTVTLRQSDLTPGGALTDTTAGTLVANSGSLDLSQTTLSGIQTLKAGSSAGTSFTLSQTNLASIGSVTGNTGTDTLVVDSTAINLSTLTLSSIEVIKAGTSATSTFTLDQANLASNGSIIGNAADSDTLVVTGSGINLSHTTLSGIAAINASGVTGADTLLGGAETLTGSSVYANTYLFEMPGVGGATITNFTSGTDTITLTKAWGLGSNWQANFQTSSTVPTAAAVSQAYLDFDTANDSLYDVGTTGSPTLIATTTGTTLAVGDIAIQSNAVNATAASVNLTPVNIPTTIGNGFTLASSPVYLAFLPIDMVTALPGTASTVTASVTDLSSTATITGSANYRDTLVLTDAKADLSQMTLSGIAVLKASNAGGASFTLSQAELASLKSMIGTAGRDTLAIVGTSVDLTGTTLSGIQVLTASGPAGTSITVNQADLATGGSVIGRNGDDTLMAGGTSLDLTHTTLSGITTLKAGSVATTLSVTQADLAGLTSVIGSNSNADTLVVTGSTVNLAATTLSGIAVVKVAPSPLSPWGIEAATTLTLAQADLTMGGSIIGANGASTIVGSGSSLDLTGITLSGIEVLQAGSATTLSVTQAELAGLKSVIGNKQDADTLVVTGPAVNLTATTLSGFEVIEASGGAGATLTLTQADLLAGGSVIGSGGDTLVGNHSLDLSHTTLSGITVIQTTATGRATLTAATTGSETLVGGTGTNTLIGSGGNDTFSTADATARTINNITAGSGDDIFQLDGLGTTTIDATNGGCESYDLGNSFGAVTIDNAVRATGSVINIGDQSAPVSFTRNGTSLTIGFDDAAGSRLTIAGEYNGSNGVATITGPNNTWTIAQTMNQSASSQSCIVVGDNTTSTITGSSVGGDILTDQHGNRAIVGSAFGNEEMSGATRDTLTAQGGGNLLHGAGHDAMTLSTSGVDTVLFDRAAEGGDIITNFTSGTDKIEVYSPNFGKLAAGTLASANFTTSAIATSCLHGFLFNTTNDSLYYAGTSTALATFTSSTITSNDIVVVNQHLL